MAYLSSWKKVMETYFDVCRHDRRSFKAQKGLFVTTLDSEMVINFEQELEVRGVESNLKNMLDIIQSIFDQLHPVNQRRAKLFDMRQGLQADWGTWIASAYEFFLPFFNLDRPLPHL